MNTILLRGGQAVGLLGMLLMVIAVGGRLAGRFTLGAYQTGTVMQAGIGALVVGCFLLLWFIADRGRG